MAQALSTDPAANDDVAYLRQYAKPFICAVDEQERLHTEVVLPLPLGTWNMMVVLQPANLVLKLLPWSNEFEADFLKLAATTGAAVPRCFRYGIVPHERLPNASYVVMEYVTNCRTAGPLFAQHALSEVEITAMGEVTGATLANLHKLAFPLCRRGSLSADVL